MTHFFLCNFTM